MINKVLSVLNLSFNKNVKVNKNISWLFGDKIFRMGIGLLLSVWIARYLGPNYFGKWNYAIALTSLLSAIGTMGLDSIVVKDILNKPANELTILGTAFLMRIVGSILVILISCLIVFVSDRNDTTLLIIVFLTSFGYIFLSFDVIDFYFQSYLNSKYTVIAKLISFVFSSLLRLVAILLKMPLLVFVYIALVEIVLGGCFLIFFYYQVSKNSPINWLVKFDFLKLKLKEAWPLILSGMVIMIYMRIDQVMLKELVGEKSVGIYSAAVRISELWYMIPTVVITSVYPSMIRLKEINIVSYHERFESLYSILFILSLIISIMIMFSSRFIVDFLYGRDYRDSSSILKVNIWAGIFVFLGVASSNYMVIENLNKISFYKTLIGAILNVGLNFFLIPKYNGLGAAIATLISYAVAAYGSNFFFTETRPLFYSMTKAIINPFQILTKN